MGSFVFGHCFGIRSLQPRKVVSSTAMPFLRL